MNGAAGGVRTLAGWRRACALALAVSLPTSRFGMQGAVILGGVVLLLSWCFEPPLPRNPLSRPGLLLLAAALLSLLLAPGGAHSLKSASSFWVWLAGWVAFSGLDTGKAGRRAVQALLACSATAAALGLFQALAGSFPGGSWLHPQAGPLPPPAPGAPGHFAATGWFDSRVSFALVLLFPWCWFLAIGLEARRPALRLALWAGAALTWGAMLASFTRAAPLAAAGAAFLMLLRWWKGRRWRLALWLLPLLGALALFAAVPGLWDRARQSFERNRDWGRLALWHTALDLASRRPLVGVGYGNFQREATPLIEGRIVQMGERRFGGVIAWAHNDLLTMLAECGLLGAFAFCFLFVAFFREAGGAYARLKPDDPWRRGFVRGSCYAVGALLFTSLFHDNFYHGEISFVLWFTMGAALALGRVGEEER
ncbi:MAG: O-antigen ligase family protein [Myxococcales bacterium]|nr:O-antigen ligase family protein [Myxococcales bacterium]